MWKPDDLAIFVSSGSPGPNYKRRRASYTGCVVRLLKYIGDTVVDDYGIVRGAWAVECEGAFLAVKEKCLHPIPPDNTKGEWDEEIFKPKELICISNS